MFNLFLQLDDMEVSLFDTCLVSVKERVPWWLKLIMKIVLSRAPVGYRVWRKLNLFVHGPMDSPVYAYQVVTSHLRRIGWPDLRDKVVLELGPGDSLLTALIARTLNAKRIYLVDVGPFADRDMRRYLHAREYLQQQGLKPPAIEACSTVPELLNMCSAEYMTQGIEDLQRIPTGSVDLVFSQAVLEHVRLHELSATLEEIHRVMAPSGVASHEVDLQDHLGAALNNLRFSARLWETQLVANSGFYTNRVRYSEMLDLFRAAGCEPEVVGVKRWDSLPTPRTRLARPFRALPEDELLVYGFTVVTRPSATGARGRKGGPAG